MHLKKEEPLYLKLKNSLKKLIDKRNLAVLPSIKNLEKRYAVSGITVRRAIAELAKEGVVTSTQGRKVMVTKHMHSDNRDIGFIMSRHSNWNDKILSYCSTQALHSECNLNLFISGKSNDITTNELYNFLLDSNKFSGLLMLSKQSEKNIKQILKKKVPFLTYNFQYKNYKIPSAMFSFKKAFSQMLDYFLNQGIKRIAFISFYESIDDIAFGMGRTFIEDYKAEIEKRNLIDYHTPVAIQAKNERKKLTLQALTQMYERPPEHRPQVITCYYNDEHQAIASFLQQHPDWTPVQVFSSNNPSHAPRLSYPHTAMIKSVFDNFIHSIQHNVPITGNIITPVGFDPGNNQ